MIRNGAYNMINKQFKTDSGRVAIVDYLLNYEKDIYACHYLDGKSDESFCEYYEYIEKNLI